MGVGVLHNVANPVDVGLHTVSEDGLAGYAAGTWGGDCNPDGTITLALDQDATCTISNDDITPTLTVLKTIVNDNGGTVTDEKCLWPEGRWPGSAAQRHQHLRCRTPYGLRRRPARLPGGNLGW